MRLVLMLGILLLTAIACWGITTDEKIIIVKSGLTKGGSSLEVDLKFKGEITIYTVSLIMPDGTQVPQEKNMDVNERYDMHLAWNISSGSFPTGTYKLRFTGKSNLVKYTLDKEIKI